jgi:Flp pilus assembly protein TadG
MLANRWRPRSGRERGNVTLEMAVVLPLLLLIVAGIIDLGLLFWEQEVIANASREGARAGARAGVSGLPRITPGAAANTTAVAVMAVVQNYLNGYGLTDAGGAPLILVNGTNFFYRFDLTRNPANLWVELRNIPVRMMLLPNIVPLFAGTFTNIVNVDVRTTMTAEWDNATPPVP